MTLKTLSLALLLAAAPAVSFAATTTTTNAQSILRLTDNGYSLDKFSKIEGVECMTLDKAMLKMAMDMGADVGAGVGEEVIKNIDKMTIATGSSKVFATLIAQDIATLKAGTTYKALAEETENGETEAVFTRSVDDVITELLIFNSDKEESAVIKMEGKFTADVLQKIAAKAAEED